MQAIQKDDPFRAQGEASDNAVQSSENKPRDFNAFAIDLEQLAQLWDLSPAEEGAPVKPRLKLVAANDHPVQKSKSGFYMIDKT